MCGLLDSALRMRRAVVLPAAVGFQGYASHSLGKLDVGTAASRCDVKKWLSLGMVSDSRKKPASLPERGG